MDITSRQRADSLCRPSHTTGELQILLEYEVAQDSLADTSVTVGLFDFSLPTNANLAPHGNAANEWRASASQSKVALLFSRLAQNHCFVHRSSSEAGKHSQLL
ncbi:hypothetical protein BLNAU_24509 [Blattamonas nauphoetae]|uniref:Uncharacterized protein n=1 Tax=Blattamonas nauphoetae TaxID=2049346 RepID=A0ABQ9WM75_9EUKA|nr:hypothetical protein BLNAU_24509 [Blattamonas nauphoetae]